MDGRPTWTDCDEAGDYVVPNVLSPRDLVFRPDNMDETVPHTEVHHLCMLLLGPELVNKILVSCILTSETCLPIPCSNSYTIFFQHVLERIMIQFSCRP